MQAKSNAPFHYNYRVTGKVHNEQAKSSNRGIDRHETAHVPPSDKSLARERVRIPGTGKRAFD